MPGLSYDGFFNQAEEIERAYGIFSEQYTVYSTDRNLTPKKGYSIKDIVDDMAEAFKKLGIKKADVLGVSLGGMVLQKLTINYPNLVKKTSDGFYAFSPERNFFKWGRTVGKPCEKQRYRSTHVAAKNFDAYNLLKIYGLKHIKVSTFGSLLFGNGSAP